MKRSSLGASVHRTPVRIIVTHVDGDPRYAQDPAPDVQPLPPAVVYIATPSTPATTDPALVTPATVSTAAAATPSAIQTVLSSIPLWGWAVGLGLLAFSAGGRKTR